MLWEANPSNPIIGFNLTSADNFLDFHEGTGAFEHLSALQPAALSLTEGDLPEPLIGISASFGLFEILGEHAGLVDPKLSAAEFKTMEDFIAQFFAGMRLLNGILSGFGGLALLLAAIGIYGVIAFSVSTRTHEIGFRMALGARRVDVPNLVVREGLVLVAIGFAIGTPGIFLVSRAIAAALSGISPFATSTVVVIGAGLFAVAFLACYVPARRAASLHPAIALRSE